MPQKWINFYQPETFKRSNQFQLKANKKYNKTVKFKEKHCKLENRRKKMKEILKTLKKQKLLACFLHIETFYLFEKRTFTDV